MINIILLSVLSFALGKVSRINLGNCKKYTNLLIFIGELIMKHPELKDDLIKLRNAVCYNQNILKARK